MPKILVVEDEPTVRRLVAGWLSAAGMSVIEASTGVQAIALVRQGSYDAIVMDVMLPDTTGFAATEGIRELPGCRTLPVIGLTGLDMRIDVAHEGGFTDLVLKPVERDVLVDAVKRNLVSRPKSNPKPPTFSHRNRQQG
jgi:CheY-like chemotaxis protein